MTSPSKDTIFTTSGTAGSRLAVESFNHGGGISLNGYGQDGDLQVYIGLLQQDEIRALAKAILNAVEPEALVENQKDAEPEPVRYNPGDWVKVADTLMYNRYFRNQTLQVVDPGYRVSDFEVVVRGTNGFTGSLLTKDVTPASAPTPEPGPTLAEQVSALDARVTALETGAKPDEIKVGDRVYVRRNQWNITGVPAAYGTVHEIIRGNERGKFLVSRDHLDTPGVGIWALDAEKVN